MPDNIAIATVNGWPKLMDPKMTARYLNEVHGLPITVKTFPQNWRSQRKGPEVKYFGTKPMCTPAACDRFAEHEALSDKSPHMRAVERRRLAGIPEPKRGGGRPRKHPAEATHTKRGGRPRKQRDEIRP